MNKYCVSTCFIGDVYMKVMLFWVSQFIGINGGIEKVFSNLLMRWFGAGILWIWYIVQKNMENYIHLSILK